MLPELKIKKPLHFLLILFLSIVFSSSFAQNWQWFSSAGGDKSDKGLDIDIDYDGNLYVSGYYNTSSSGNVMFAALTPSMGFGKEGYMAKIDSSGNWKWVIPAIGGWDERALGICVDKINRFVYITGTCWNDIDFGTCVGTGTFPNGRDNVFIAKSDFYGNCQWVLGGGTSNDDHGYDLVTDKSGNIYVTGFFGPDPSGAILGTLNTAAIPNDSIGFVAKLTPAGNFKWVTLFPGVDGERDNRIAIDDSAHLYITGSFYGTRSYGTQTVTSNGGQDIYVLKLDSAGNQLWVQTAGSTLDDRGNSVTVDGMQNVYVTGEFRDIVIFGTDTVNNYGGPGGRDIFVSKITKNGNWKWASKAGSTNGSDRGNRIVSNNRDLLFVTGQIKGTAKFGAINAICNPLDSIQVFAAAIDTTGIWRWVMQGGSHLEDRGTGIATDELCHVYITGYYQDTACFGAYCDTAVNKKDIVVARINSNCNAVGIGIKEYSDFSSSVLFPNPSSGKFTIQLDKYYDVLTVEVYNIMGQILQSRKLNSVNKTEISINESSGIYFIKLLNSNGSSRIFKAIKE